MTLKEYMSSCKLIRNLANLPISPFVRYDKTIKYDKNPEPNQRDVIDDDKNFFIFGLSTNYAF